MKRCLKFNIINFFILTFFTFLISIIRIIQLQFFTDFNLACNNFKSYNVLNFNINLKSLSCFMYVIIILYFFITLFLNFKNSKHNNNVVLLYEIENKSGLFVRICLFMFFLITIISSVLYLKDLKYLKLKGFFISGLTLTTFFSQILLSIYFLYFLYCLKFNNFNKKSFLNIIFVLPTFWGIIRMLGFMYLSYFYFLTPREILFNILKISSFSVFLLYFGRVLIGLNSKKNNRNLIFSGFLSIFFGFISVVPKIVIYFVNIYNLNFVSSRTYDYNINILRATNFVFVDLVVLFFIIIFLIKYIFYWSKN